MGQYPVIYLTFKDSKRESFERSYEEMVWVIAEDFKRHDFVSKHPKLTKRKDKFENIVREKGSRKNYEASILFLSQCLETYYGKKVIIIIDEKH